MRLRSMSSLRYECRYDVVTQITQITFCNQLIINTKYFY